MNEHHIFIKKPLAEFKKNIYDQRNFWPSFIIHDSMTKCLYLFVINDKIKGHLLVKCRGQSKIQSILPFLSICNEFKTKQNKCKTKQKTFLIRSSLLVKDRNNQRYMAFFFHSKAYTFYFKKGKQKKKKKKEKNKTKQNKTRKF